MIDDIFSRVKAGDEVRDKSGRERTATPGVSTLTPAVTGDGEGLPAQATPTGQPTEVILYGFPAAFQYAAIDHYERVSQGMIYEEYDRYPPNSKYNLSLSLGRSHLNSTKLSKEAMLKKNRYHGGEHWIKVTFDSAEAAERACHYSPHVIKGHIVHAEPYRGSGPSTDVAIPATEAAVASVTASPSQDSSRTLQIPPGGISETASSATATGIEGREESASSSATAQPPQTPVQRKTRSPLSPTASTSSKILQTSPKKTIRIPGVKGLEPSEKALLPAQSSWHRTFSNLPLIGLLFGGGNDVIGNQVPRKEDGSFDWQNASSYWRFWAYLDWMLKSDFCGIRE